MDYVFLLSIRVQNRPVRYNDKPPTTSREGDIKMTKIIYVLSAQDYHGIKF